MGWCNDPYPSCWTKRQWFFWTSQGKLDTKLSWIANASLQIPVERHILEPNASWHCCNTALWTWTLPFSLPPSIRTFFLTQAPFSASCRMIPSLHCHKGCPSCCWNIWHHFPSEGFGISCLWTASPGLYVRSAPYQDASSPMPSGRHPLQAPRSSSAKSRILRPFVFYHPRCRTSSPGISMQTVPERSCSPTSRSSASRRERYISLLIWWLLLRWRRDHRKTYIQRS